MLTYLPRDDLWHKLNSLTVLAFSGTIFLLALLFSHPICLLLLAAIALTGLAEAGGRKEMREFLYLSAPMAMAILVFNLLVSRSGTTLFYAGWPFSLEAAVYGLAMSLRLLALTAAFGILSVSVRPEDLLNKSPFFAGRPGLALALGLRLFPVLLAEQERIVLAQRARGVRLASGPRLNRLRNLLAVWQPLLLNTLEKAWQLGEAMQARGLGSGRRSVYKVERWRREDFLALAGIFAGLAGGIAAAWQGVANFNFYPRLEPLFSFGHPWWLALMAAGLSLPLIMAWRWRHWAK
ncbi:MAG: energy-coupling factor transport system permease protein [Clostridia bacterium]|nr:energy-coupling factor transport system permease protein [Clostridia bacterium]